MADTSTSVSREGRPKPDIDRLLRTPAALVETAERMLASGRLRPRERIERDYRTFQDRFGPAEISRLSGRELLETLHVHDERKDSLVYWLEFKNDDEFPGPSFGSIAGGSALKLGLYRARDTGLWMTGSSRRMIPLSEEQAIARATQHRDQLLAGVRVLDGFIRPDLSDRAATDAAYRKLDEDLRGAAPLVADLAWGHKYFSLHAPDVLDDYHSPGFQRFHLTRLLQPPPEGDPRWRYACAGRFAALAHDTGLMLNQLTAVLNQVNGRPYGYWRVGTDIDRRKIWNDMRDGGFAAVGWADLGDLSSLRHDVPGRERIARALQETYGVTASVGGKKAREILDFVAGAGVGDVIVAADGQAILGVGRIAGPYVHDPDRAADAPHQRDVDWYDVPSWRADEREGLLTTFKALKGPSFQIALERKLQQAPDTLAPRRTPTRPAGAAPRAAPVLTVALDPVVRDLKAILDRKGQAILYGPPGTGKTYWARRAITELAARDAHGKAAADLSEAERTALWGPDGVARMVTFHPGYGYEDFIEGYRPVAVGGALAFELRAGAFKTLCDKAAADGRQRYLLIDEINRGDIPRIFGELITLLEADKRGLSVTLPSGEPFAVPPSVRVIGTMNTADRSIALLDVALRRRFGFVELLPDTRLLGDRVIDDRLPLGDWLNALNAGLRSALGRDGRNLQIGHGFFIGASPVTTASEFAAVLAHDIVPLLQEYAYEDPAMLRGLIGDLFDGETQRIRSELFALERLDELLTKLLAAFPDLTASLSMVEHDQESNADEEESAPTDDPA